MQKIFCIIFSTIPGGKKRTDLAGIEHTSVALQALQPTYLSISILGSVETLSIHLTYNSGGTRDPGPGTWDLRVHLKRVFL